MLARWLLAYLHLLALGIGLGAVWVRARSLDALSRGGSVRPVFASDTWWLLALTLWLVTGLVRAFAGLEKPGEYYLYNSLFWWKMAVFAGIFVIELWPMTTILHWGFRASKGHALDFGPAPGLARLSRIQAWLVLLGAGLAAALARGAGLG